PLSFSYRSGGHAGLRSFPTRRSSDLDGAARPAGGGVHVTWQDPRLRADYAPADAEHPGEYPYTRGVSAEPGVWIMGQYAGFGTADRKSTRLNSSHVKISYAVLCLKKK